MPSGGHARSGPAPDPNALRRDRDASEWVHLPPGEPRTAPQWPLTRPTRREMTLWHREWARPQAHMWRALGLELEVALYVRNTVAAEAPDASPPARTLVMRQMDSLGLTVGGLARNRWVIDSDRGNQERQEAAAPAASRSAKDRLKLVG